MRIDDLEVVQDFFELSFANLKEDLLLLLSVLVLFQIHLDIEDGLLNPFLLFAGDFDIHAPVEVLQLGQSTELFLVVFFYLWSHFSHGLEKECLELLFEALWESGCQLCFVHHSASNVLLH